ncbi:DltB-like membrane protein [Leptospira ryugenii]|uniref:DltB-like membrane protein n=1 Tax=Leptospira ryugenii TaxID=1917863 RepID=A0A2P2DX73_9LEPT|nr:MBOAT family O-acyltransferase [Leptospira ryugenii]GBF49206.1 DltB-like membrane protein [Leptospira ryugenii]
MKFTSLSFLLFFFLVYCIHWALRGKFRIGFLLIASILFYAAWSVPFAFHFLGLVAFNHFANKQILKNKGSFWFYLILLLNFGNLFLFKYFYFVWETVFLITASPVFAKDVLESFLSNQFGFASITLPLAISFYSFQMIAYNIDVKRGEAEENPNFAEFALFIFFFPQLVAGPIVRHGEFFHQLGQWNLKREQAYQGTFLIFLGLLKKVVLADNIALVIDPIFRNPDQYDAVSNFAAYFGYSCRVFCDFSGYTDLARGLGKLLGIELPENFRAPFLSKSVSELWTRWHMTLASWIKDYIYIPLGGSRVGELRSYFNLLLMFALTGLWHGANFTFIIWGLIQGFFLCLERKWKLMQITIFKQSNVWTERTQSILGVVYSFTVFSLAAAFFNAPNVKNGWSLWVNSLTGHSGQRTPKLELLLYSLVITFLLNYLQEKPLFPKEAWSNQKSFFFLFGFGFLAIVLLGYLSPGGTEFIYFQF